MLKVSSSFSYLAMSLLLQINNLSLPVYCWSSHSFSSLVLSCTTFILRWNQMLTSKSITGNIRMCCKPKYSQKVLLLLMEAFTMIMAVCSKTINTGKDCLTTIFLSLLMTTNFIMPVPLEHTCSLLQLCSWIVLYDRFLFIILIVVRVVVNIIVHCTCISLKSVEQTVMWS